MKKFLIASLLLFMITPVFAVQQTTTRLQAEMSDACGMYIRTGGSKLKYMVCTYNKLDNPYYFRYGWSKLVTGDYSVMLSDKPIITKPLTVEEEQLTAKMLRPQLKQMFYETTNLLRKQDEVFTAEEVKRLK